MRGKEGRAMSPEVIAVAELFILRLGVPLLMVLGGGYLASRYVQSRVERARQRQATQQRAKDVATTETVEKEKRWRKAA